jgi:hypothetical protein
LEEKMARPRLTWIGVLLAVLIACALALTLAGGARATEYDEFGKEIPPPAVTYGATGGTAAPSDAANALQSDEGVAIPLHQNTASTGGWNITWLLILAAVIIGLLAAIIVARVTGKPPENMREV